MSQWCSRTCTSPPSRRSRRSPVARRSCSTRAPTTSRRCGFPCTSGSSGSATRSASSPRRRRSSCGAGSASTGRRPSPASASTPRPRQRGARPPVAITGCRRTALPRVRRAHRSRARERSSSSSGSVVTKPRIPARSRSCSSAILRTKCAAHPDVFLTGIVDESTRKAIVDGSLALVHPSHYESFSLVLMEGWAAGKAAAVQALSPVLAGHARRSGGALPYRNEEELGEVVDLLVSQPALRERLGEAGRAYVACSLSMGRRARAARIAAGPGSILKAVPPTPEVVNAPRPDHWHHRPRRPAPGRAAPLEGLRGLRRRQGSEQPEGRDGEPGAARTSSS